MLGTTLMGVEIMEQAVWVRVSVPGGTYSGSHSLFETMISRFNRAADLEYRRE